MSDSGDERERWEELRASGLEPAAPEGFSPDDGEDGGFEEVAGGV